MMNEQMLESIAENRGYDKGFTAGTYHAHELLTQYVSWLKDYRCVLEEEGDCQREVACYQTQINALEDAKHLIRKGHWGQDDSSLPKL